MKESKLKGPTPSPVVQVIDILFTKEREVIFISHLDLVRLFIRLFRRIKLPLYYTQGFNPHPRLRFQRALSLGVKSTKEVVTVFLRETVNCKEVKGQLSHVVPSGVRIKKVELHKDLKKKEVRSAE